MRAVPAGRILAAIAVLLVVLTGFTWLPHPYPHPHYRAPERPLYGGAVERRGAPPPSLPDPAAARTIAERETALLCSARLLALAADGSVVGEAAQSWELSADRLTLVLTLRPDVVGADGEAPTAADVVASLERLLVVNPDCAAALLLLDLQGAESFRRGEAENVAGLRAEGERTVVLTLRRPQPLLTRALADANAALAAPRSTGPFAADDAGRCRPNLRFFRGRPYLDLVILGGTNEVADPTWRRPVLAAVGDNPGVAEGAVPVQYPGRRCVYLAANQDRPALRDAAVRRAVAAAVSPGEMVRIFFGSAARPLRHLVPDGSLPEAFFHQPTPLDGEAVSAPRGRLLIGYPAGDGELELVAERARVDLLEAGIGSDVAAFGGGTAGACDLLVVEALIADGSAGYGIWRLLAELAALSGDRSWLRRPSGDAVAWLVGLDHELISDGRLLPLYHTGHRLWADRRLRGLRLRPDGTLDFESAWITAAGESER